MEIHEIILYIAAVGVILVFLKELQLDYERALRNKKEELLEQEWAKREIEKEGEGK